MDTWFSVELGDGIQAYEPSNKIQDVFIPIFTAAQYPIDMAVFSRYDLEQNIVTAYFSPSAFEVAKIFKAKPCEKPSRDGLALLIGDVRVWGIHYPTQ
jgi:hypothetical protein